MGLSVKVANFTWLEADIAGTNHDVNFGFTPKFIVAWISGQASTTDAVGRDTNVTGIGFGTSSSDRRSMAYGSVDAQANAFLIIRHSDAALLSVGSATGTDGGSLDIAAEAGWPANSIRFVIDTALGAGAGNLRVSVLAIGGTDITGQKTLQFQEAGATGDQDVVGFGFDPIGVMFASVGFATVPPAGSAAQGMLSFGATDGTRSWVWMGGADDGNTTMDTRSYMKSGEVIALGPEPAVTLDARATVVSLITDGVRINWTERASTRYIFALGWKGGRFRVDNLLTATDLNNFTDTGYGFAPLAALFASACRAESTADTPTDHTQLSLGAATSASERVAQATLDEDGVGTSETSTAIEHDEVYANISTASAIQGLMDLVSFDSDGMTVVMDDADPVASFVGVAAFGAGVAAELVAAVTATASVAAALTTSIALVAALTGTATTAAALTTSITPAAAVSGIATVAADLTTAISLAATAAGTATATGALSTSITPAATVSGTATATGALTTSIALAGAVSGVATLSGTLDAPVGAALSASVLASSSTSADLTVMHPSVGGRTRRSTTAGRIKEDPRPDTRDYLNRVVAAVNGRLSIGRGVSGEWSGNMDGQTVEVVFPSTSNEELVVPHGLNRTPWACFPAIPETSGVVYASRKESWNSKAIYLKSTVPNLKVWLWLM